MAVSERRISCLSQALYSSRPPSLSVLRARCRDSLSHAARATARRPPAQRIRLIGGNDGTDWTNVRVVEDLAPYPYKTNLLPHLLIEHLAKAPGNRTLVVYGDAHIRYQGNNFMGDLEAALGRRKLFVVG